VGRGRVAHLELRREFDAKRLDSLAFDQPRQQADGDAPELGQRLSDRGQRWYRDFIAGQRNGSAWRVSA
jgi:hypothetical protein